MLFRSSIRGLPKARSLYGSLPDQLQDPDSFASRLKAMFALRDSHGIAQSELVAVPVVSNPGVVVLVNKLPRQEGKSQSWQITALNFGRSAIEETLELPGLPGEAEALWSNLEGPIAETVAFANESLTFQLAALEARLIVVS